MYSNGFVKRIDNLGRIVLPKEIRKKLSLHENDEIEMLIDGDKIILKKYSTLLELKEDCKNYVTILERVTGENILFVDKEKVIAACGKNSSSILNKKINLDISQMIENRTEDFESNIKIIDSDNIYSKVIIPIIADSKAIGAVILYDTDSKSINKKYVDLLRLVSLLITSKIEV